MLPFTPVGVVSDDWQVTSSILAPYNDETKTVTKSNHAVQKQPQAILTVHNHDWRKNKKDTKVIGTI